MDNLIFVLVDVLIFLASAIMVYFGLKILFKKRKK